MGIPQSSPAWARYTGQTRQRRAANRHYLISQDANPQPQISKDATKKRVARTVTCYRSGIDGYELYDNRRKQLFGLLGRYFANFSSSVGSISKEI